MRTIEIKVYSFDELNEEAKETALYNFKPCIDFIYDDARQTILNACELLGLKTSSNSWLEPDLNCIDDNIMNLSGLRLRKYFLNNFELYKGKHYNVKANKPIKHNRVVTKGPFKTGNYFVAYYSAIQKEACSILTGMCYDDYFLRPIYDLIAFKDKNLKNKTFEDVIIDCFHSLEKTLKSEEEYSYSEEGKTEEIIANDYEFLEDGSIY